MVTLLQSISCRILIEQFGWPPAGKRANRTTRFCESFVEEVNKITSNELMDIRKYNDEVERLYGIRFQTEEGEKW